jgi:Cu(I)/Ag(I) efflux system membrane fusion protein
MKNERYEPGKMDPTTTGDAGPPRFAKTMGIIRWIIFGAIAVFALTMVVSYFGGTAWVSKAEEASQYHCPMHPTVVSDQPGDCPICGMSLVPVRSADSAQTTQQYHCPMHPTVVSDEPGDCPICGMNLVPIKGGGAPAAAHGDASSHASNVPGLASITLEPRRVQMIGLKTGVVERRPIQAQTRLVGYVTVDETKTAGINVRTSGWVQTLRVDQTGQDVSRGAPLLSLYSQDLYAAQQDLLVALRAHERSANDPVLVEARARVLDAARDRLRLLGMPPDALTELEATGEAESELTLRSPISGVVMEKNVVEGEYITPDMTLFRIADLRTIWVLAEVYERDIASVHVGSPVRMSVTAFPGEVFEGTVGFIYPSVSETTRTLTVRLEFPNPLLTLRPGMYAEVRLLESGPEVLAVPAGAVMDGGETEYAFVVYDGTSFEPRLIETGRRADEWIEILSGLEAGERVVTSTNFLIDSESRLQAAIAGMTSHHAQSSH